MILEEICCPCCGYNTIQQRARLEICKICGWEDDGQDNHNADEVLGGPNANRSLTEARRDFILHGEFNPKCEQLSDANREQYTLNRSFKLGDDGTVVEQIFGSPTAPWGAVIVSCGCSVIGWPSPTSPKTSRKWFFINDLANKILTEAGFVDKTGRTISIFLTVSSTEPLHQQFYPGLPGTMKLKRRKKSIDIHFYVDVQSAPTTDLEWFALEFSYLKLGIRLAFQSFQLEAPTTLAALDDEAKRWLPLLPLEKYQKEVNAIHADQEALQAAEPGPTEQKFKPSQPPDLIAIEHDDYHARYVGRTAEGQQFFLTTPFEPNVDGPTNEYVALFLFNSAGHFIEAKIEALRPRKTENSAKESKLIKEWIKELGKVSFERIEVQPFSIDKHGTTFGLISHEPGTMGDDWIVELQPGNYMSFHAPWDSGEYDT